MNVLALFVRLEMKQVGFVLIFVSVIVNECTTTFMITLVVAVKLQKVIDSHHAIVNGSGRDEVIEWCKWCGIWEIDRSRCLFIENCS